MNREDLERLCSGRSLRDWIAGEVMGRLLIGPWYIWIWRGVCKVASYPASWIVAILTALAMLGGCANGPLSSCDTVDIQHHRKGSTISGSATWSDCRPIQPALPALL